MVKDRNNGVIGASWKWKLGVCYPALLSSHGSMIMWTDHCKFMKDAGFNGAGTRETYVRHVCGGHQGGKSAITASSGCCH